MKQQINQYGTDSVGKSVLYITQTNGNVIVASFPSEFLAEIKMFQWSYKGKNGIFNDFNQSLASYFAEVYGYTGRNWRRKDPTSSSYMPDNYQVKLLETGTSVKNWKPIADENRFKGREQSFYERMKWASKYACETLNVAVGMTNVAVTVNSYLRQFIPTEADFKNGELHLFNGDSLAKHIAINAGGVNDDVQRVSKGITGRNNVFDYRIDPNTLRFANTVYSHRRIHRVTDGIIIEMIDSPADSSKWSWKWHVKDSEEQFLVGENGSWRRSFVLIDAKMLPALERLSPDLVVYYNFMDMEWMIHEPYVEAATGEKLVKKHQLKRVLLRESGAKVDYEYFEPRMTKAYAAALKAAEASEAYGEADRRRAKFENATGEDKAKMFVKPKVQHHRKIYAHRNYFSTEIYGGVGVWCKDLRCDSMLIGTNAQLQGVVVDDKTQIRKRRT